MNDELDDLPTLRDLRTQLEAAEGRPAAHRVPGRTLVMVLASALIGAAAVAIAATTHSAKHASPSAAVTRLAYCGGIVDSRGSISGDTGFRLVLGGDVAVPPAFLPTDVDLRQPGHWRYWLKSVIDVRAHHGPLLVTVPGAWRRTVAIAWGHGIGGYGSTVRIAACGPAPNAWNSWVGGFRLHTRTACFPLAFRIGARHQTVWFGIGRRCRSSRV